MAFDIERFVSLSRAIDLSGIDWANARRLGLAADEVRVLVHMQDIESHTILYLRDLLSGYATRDPEVMTFLACWVYEETHHGRALDRMLVETGHAPARGRHDDVHVKPKLREVLTDWAGRVAASSTPHFAAVHMAWGAANELAAALSYQQLARRSANTELQKLCHLLAKDERRHFAFYYDQAERRLRSGGRVAQRLCAGLFGRFWVPVGSGLGGATATDFCASYMFSDERGRRDAMAIDDAIRALPGLGGWRNLAHRWAREGAERMRRADPETYARHRRIDARLGDEPRAA